jgi:hypothetical protein
VAITDGPQDAYVDADLFFATYVMPDGGGPGGGGPGPGPGANTPELSSLLLFGSGAATFAGYARLRLHGIRRRKATLPS